jgi:hypothetical protein
MTINKNGFLFVKKIDPLIKQKFKVLCLRRGITMAQAIEAMMREAVKPKRKESAR